MMKTKDFFGNEWDIDCMGCAIGNQSMLVPGGLIQNTNHFCVHQDPLIPLPGFLVIATLKHIQSITEMSAAEYDEFSRLVRTVHCAIKEATKVEYLTIIQEESSPHFHLWFFPWTRNVVEQYGQPSLAKIREIMAEYRKQSINAEKWVELQKSIETIKNMIPNLTYIP